ISGRTAPGTLVEISVDGQSYVAQVTPGGLWTLLPAADLAVGNHELLASATDPEQNVSDTATSRFSIAETGFARGGCSSGGMPTPVLAVAMLLAWMRRRRRVSLACALAIPATPLLARAQEIDVSLFRPASGGDGFAAVEGARPPLAGEPRLELRTWTDYAVHPLTYVTSSGAEQPLVRGRAMEWLGAQVHLVGPLSLSAQVPVTVSSTGSLSQLSSSSGGSSQLSSGFADLRLTPRLGLLRQEWAGIDLAAQMSFELPTAHAQSYSGDGRVRVEGLVAAGRRLAAVPAGDLDLLANAYVRRRRRVDRRRRSAARAVPPRIRILSRGVRADLSDRAAFDGRRAGARSRAASAHRRGSSAAASEARGRRQRRRRDSRRRRQLSGSAGYRREPRLSPGHPPARGRLGHHPRDPRSGALRNRRGAHPEAVVLAARPGGRRPQDAPGPAPGPGRGAHRRPRSFLVQHPALARASHGGRRLPRLQGC